MRLRSLLLGLILLSLLACGTGFSISSAASYRTSAASLRSLWAADILSGVNPTQLAPLEAQLDAADSSSFLSLPASTLNPFSSQRALQKLRAQTDAIYASDLSASRANALAARTTLRLAFAPASATQLRLWSQDLNEASTPNDYQSLADAWSLQAKLVPLDEALQARTVTLDALTSQAASLALSTRDALAMQASIAYYFTLPDASRYPLASDLTARASSTITSLQSSITAELQARAAAAAAAARAQALAQAQALASAQAHAQAAAAANQAANAPLYLTLNGDYNDCTGATLLQGGLYKDTCVSFANAVYLVSHKWSVGASFFRLHVGSVIYFQGRRYTVYRDYTITPAGEVARLYQDMAPLTLQTCYTDSGSVLLMIEAH